MTTKLRVENLSKTFVLHNQSSGKSTLLRSLYGNYLPDSGKIWVEHQGQQIDMVSAEAREILSVRRHTVGWVSQFLRVIPRISALNLVMQPLLELGVDKSQSEARASALLRHLNVPERLWHLAPSTFSGGEQQRVNIARGFVVDYPVLLLDEPTASLDATNRAAVVTLIEQAKARGAAVVGIFHDGDVRERVADRLYEMSPETAPEMSA